jgi:hypothetical protein
VEGLKRPVREGGEEVEERGEVEDIMETSVMVVVRVQEGVNPAQ